LARGAALALVELRTAAAAPNCLLVRRARWYPPAFMAVNFPRPGAAPGGDPPAGGAGPANSQPFQFNPDDLAYIENPYPTYRYLREHVPAYWWEAGRAWVFSRYADVVAILREPRFSMDFQDWEHAQRRSGGEESEFGRLIAKALFTLPPGEHARVRRLVGRVFTPRALEWVREPTQTIVDAHLPDAKRTTTFDLAREFADPIPLRVIGAMLDMTGEL